MPEDVRHRSYRTFTIFFRSSYPALHLPLGTPPKMGHMQTGTFQTSSATRARRRADGPNLTVVAGRPDPVCTRSRMVSRDHPAFGHLAQGAAEPAHRPDGGALEAEPEALDPMRSTRGSGQHSSTGPASSGSGPQIDHTHVADDADDRTDDGWELHRWRFAQRVAEWEADALQRGVTWSD
jgi:hypothetical protein